MVPCDKNTPPRDLTAEQMAAQVHESPTIPHTESPAPMGGGNHGTSA